MRQQYKPGFLESILNTLTKTFQKLFLTVFLSIMFAFIVAGSDYSYSFSVAKAKQRASKLDKLSSTVQKVVKIYKYIPFK